jgi:hypothetical protein
VIVTDAVADWAVGSEPSVIRTVSVVVEAALGVPVIAPVAAFRLRPAGSEPEATLQR